MHRRHKEIDGDKREDGGDQNATLNPDVLVESGGGVSNSFVGGINGIGRHRISCES